MTAYRFTGFYPAHYDTPEGSRMVKPGDVVDWDTPPDVWWTDESSTPTADSDDEHLSDLPDAPAQSDEPHLAADAAPTDEE